MTAQKGYEIAIVYGAGASHDSGYQMLIDSKYINPRRNSPPQRIEPPLDRNFFGQDLVRQVAANFPSIQSFIKKYFKYPDGVFDLACKLGLEEVWSAVDLNHKHIGLRTFDWKAATQDYAHDLNEEWKDIIDTDHDPMSPGVWRANEYKLLSDCGRHLKQVCYCIYGNPTLSGEDNYWKLHELLTKRNGRHRIEYVTFNYDTCLERSLYTKSTPLQYVTDYDIPNVGFTLNDRVHIAKLHGSINWILNVSNKVEPVKILPVRYSEPKDESAFWAVEPQYPTRDKSKTSIREPLIIPPTWFKNEINDDARAEDRVTQLILHQWRVALDILRRAKLIIVVGYSFPSVVFHVQRLFKLAVMDRASTKLLYCVQVNEQEQEMMKEKISFLRLGESDIQIEPRGFRVLCQENVLKERLNNLGFSEFR